MFELLFRAFARRVAIPILLILRCELAAKVFRLFSVIAGTSKAQRPPKTFAITTRHYSEKVSNELCEFRQIVPATTHLRKAPRTNEPELHWRFREALEEKMPEVFLAKLKNGRVLGPSGAVISGDETLLGDLSFEWFFEPHQHSSFFKLRLPLQQKLNSAVTLASPSGGTYFHWMMDVLPRLAILEQAGIDFHAQEKFIFNFTRAPFQSESLDLIGIPRERRVFTDPKTHFACEGLLAPSLPGTPGRMPGWAVEFLRKQFLPHAKPVTGGDRIYISRQRSKYRKFINEAEVNALLSSLGFREVFLEELPFLDQLSLFASASVVVAGHGAGLTNLVFAKPGTKVVEIFSPNYVNPCFWAVADILNLDYVYTIGQGPRPKDGHDPHRVEENITVDIAALSKLLKLQAIG